MKTQRLLLLFLLLFLLAIPIFAQDNDQDGVVGTKDKCPNIPAPNTSNGCPNTPAPEPLADSDGDGMPDIYDNCPNDGGSANNTGCPENTTPVPQTNDGDGDGFPDEQDACPNQAGSAGGCDLVVIEDEGDCVAATEGGNRVNIRENPLENAAIVGQLLPTETKLITGINISNNNPQSPSIWVQVDIGFINTGVIRIGGDCSDLVSDEEGEPTMTAEFALEYDCSTTPRVVIVSDETPLSHYMGSIATYAPWWIYPDVLYSARPLPTEPDIIIAGNIIIGTPCDDLIIGTHDTDIIDGLGGNDMIVGLRGYDALVGNAGNDQLLGMTLPPLGGETNGNILVGGAGNDVLNAAGTLERLDGGDGDDVLIGNGDDNLRGGAGNDRLSGGTLASGGSGDDTITGTLADDRLSGNAGQDRIEGSAGHDTIDGGDDRDFLFGNLGDDIIRGGNGNDLIQAHLGNDQVFGGEGDDRIEFFWGGIDTGEGENGNDRIDIRYLTHESFDLDRPDYERERGVLAEGAYFSGGNGDDFIYDDYGFWEGLYVPLKGGAGNDRIHGGGHLFGGDGNDTLYVTNSDSRAYGGNGDDRITVFPDLYGEVLLYGDAGNDFMVGHYSVDLMFGGDGNDRMIGMAGGDYLNGGNGDDRISGGPNIVEGTDPRTYFDSPNYIDSGAGRDNVDGGPNRDVQGDTCIVDSADTHLRCEVTTWPSIFVMLVFWQPYFDDFGI